MKLPKAKVSRRLFGSGVEFFAYVFGLIGLSVVSTLTFGVLDGFLAPLLVLAICLRDANSGRFSIAKRLGKMRVVQSVGGAPASNIQGLKRNACYWLLCALMMLPFLPLDALASTAFLVLLILDMGLIIGSKSGRRVGDLIAGTQVVNEETRSSS